MSFLDPNAPTPLDLVEEDDPRLQKLKQQAYTDALRRQERYGSLFQSAGNLPGLSRAGAAMERQAAQQELQSGQIPGMRLQNAVRQEQIDQMRQREEERNAFKDPRVMGLNNSLVQRFGKNIGIDVGDLSGVNPAAIQPLIRNLETASLAKDREHQKWMQLHGPGSLEDQVKTLADGVERGITPPDPKGLYRYGGALKAELAKRGFDLTRATLDWMGVNRHISSLNSNQQLRVREAVTNAIGQVGNIEELYKQWQAVNGKNSSIVPLSRANLTLAANMGGETGKAAAALLGQINLLSSEVGTALMGGNSPTDHALQQASTLLKGEWDEKTFMEAVRVLRKDLQIRANSLSTAAPAGMAGPNQYWRGATSEQQMAGVQGMPTPPASVAPPAGGAESFLPRALQGLFQNNPQAQPVPQGQPMPSYDPRTGMWQGVTK